jgi:hypothetical protein
VLIILPLTSSMFAEILLSESASDVLFSMTGITFSAIFVFYSFLIGSKSDNFHPDM